jgi:hypothetical protein
MQIVPVTDKRTANQFLDVAREVYKNDQIWVCPPDDQIRAVFDPAQNVFFKHGEAARWILLREGRLIGRVAAFINREKAFMGEIHVGGMGFFECIEDREAAFMLMEQCTTWLAERGMEAMDGPINFGENDNFWGLLVEGFTHPAYGMPYNPTYYRQFFEAYGFEIYFEQKTKHLDFRNSFPDRFWKIADWVRQKPGFKYLHLDKAQISRFLDDFKKVYDQAWKFHDGFTPINKEDLMRTFSKSKAIIDEELIWFAYHENEPIGLCVIFPDINEMIKSFKGKMGLFNKLRLLYRLKTHQYSRARMVIMGVVPKYQKYGIESAIFWHMNDALNRRPWIHEVELSWVGDFNPKMQALHESVGAVDAKKHFTYRKIFSGKAKVERIHNIPTTSREFERENS